jgi:hypothetical protein
MSDYEFAALERGAIEVTRWTVVTIVRPGT